MDEPTLPDRPATDRPEIADGLEHPLDPRSIRLGRLGCWIVTASIATGWALALGILLLTPAPGWVKGLVATVWIPVVAGLAWLSHRWPEIEHRHVAYRVDALGIEIRRGVFWKSVVNVPRSRVQHTDVSQGPVERRFGLGTLRIHTAGTEHAEVDLHGLDQGTALRIRDHLVAAGDGDAV